ncbi:MAG TPA: type II secretion system protein [Candidatus Saccharimonadales bacterium]|nr:type II secretion system protein [Candidatus Saccharimonadales bacterium]
MKNQKGFTLLELLVVISIISVVGIVVGGILTSTLRGSSKVNTVSNVKQNGDYALAQMSRVIRSASNLDLLPCGNPSTAVQTLTATQLDNTQTVFDCSGTTITANGTSLLDTSVVQLVPSSCMLICTQQSSADIPVVQIKFSLMQKSSSTFSEQTANIPFQTSILLRNVQQQ